VGTEKIIGTGQEDSKIFNIPVCKISKSAPQEIQPPAKSFYRKPQTQKNNKNDFLMGKKGERRKTFVQNTF